MEVKWAKQSKLNVTGDHEKLSKYHSANSSVSCYLCVFGKKSDIEKLELNVVGFQEYGNSVIAEFGQTRFGCRVFRLDNETSRLQSSPKGEMVA
jgi:hypothetical protein